MSSGRPGRPGNRPSLGDHRRTHERRREDKPGYARPYLSAPKTKGRSCRVRGRPAHRGEKRTGGTFAGKHVRETVLKAASAAT